jgi:hypothetical protein
MSRFPFLQHPTQEITMTTSVVAARAVIDQLKSQIAAHQKTLTGIGARRKKFAFAASQGNKAARTALTEIQVDETASKAALENLKLALIEAEEVRAGAADRELQEADAAAAARVAELSEDLIEADRAIEAALVELHAKLDHRVELITQIRSQRVLSDHVGSRLSDPAPATNAIVDGLLKHLGRHAASGWYEGAATRLAYTDGKLLGIKVGEPVLTAVEEALRRSTEPTRFGRVA